MIPYDNGAAPFVDGRARTPRDGKIGVIDERLDLVIPARFDWAFPFEAGTALVCNGCRLSAPDHDGHRRVVGGVWGRIDIEGRETVPISYPCEELERIGGRARRSSTPRPRTARRGGA